MAKGNQPKAIAPDATAEQGGETGTSQENINIENQPPVVLEPGVADESGAGGETAEKPNDGDTGNTGDTGGTGGSDNGSDELPQDNTDNGETTGDAETKDMETPLDADGGESQVLEDAPVVVTETPVVEAKKLDRSVGLKDVEVFPAPALVQSAKPEVLSLVQKIRDSIADYPVIFILYSILDKMFARFAPGIPMDSPEDRSEWFMTQRSLYSVFVQILNEEDYDTFRENWIALVAYFHAYSEMNKRSVIGMTHALRHPWINNDLEFALYSTVFSILWTHQKCNDIAAVRREINFDLLESKNFEARQIQNLKTFYGA